MRLASLGGSYRKLILSPTKNGVLIKPAHIYIYIHDNSADLHWCISEIRVQNTEKKTGKTALKHKLVLPTMYQWTT